MYTRSAGSAHISISPDKETCGPAQTLWAYNVTADKHTGADKQRQMWKFTHVFGYNGSLFTLQLDRDGDADVTSWTFLTFPLQIEATSRPISGIKWPVADTGSASLSAGVIFATQGGHKTSASTPAVVPAVFRNLGYSTHSWRSPHMTCRRWEPRAIGTGISRISPLFLQRFQLKRDLRWKSTFSYRATKILEMGEKICGSKFWGHFLTAMRLFLVENALIDAGSTCGAGRPRGCMALN